VVALGGERPVVIVGIGGNNPAAAIDLGLFAKRAGAQGVMLCAPYYNKCTQAGALEFFNTVANAVGLPMIVYNVPARTGMNLEPQTLAKIAENQYIAGIKEASGNVAQVAEVIALTHPVTASPCHPSMLEGNTNSFFRKSEKPITNKTSGQFPSVRGVPSRARRGVLAVYCGDDALALPCYALGCDGVISVASNVDPVTTRKIWTSRSAKLFLKQLPIYKALFCEVNPIPVKYALHLQGFCTPEMRLPLTTLSEDSIVKHGFRKLFRPVGD